MIIETFIPEKVKELYQRYEQQGRQLPDGVNYIDSWIDEDVKTCYQLMESDSFENLNLWISRWNDLADFKVIRVKDSATAKRIVLNRT